MMEKEIKACIRASLETLLDPALKEKGFSRAKNSLVYKRELPEAVQKIDVALEIHPKDRPDSAAAVYPWLEILLPEVDKVVQAMIGRNLGLLPGITGGTLREPIQFTSAKAMGARWYVFQPDSVPQVISELKLFLQLWTLPFMDQYSTAAAVCFADEGGDARVLRDRAQDLRIVAATLVEKGPQEALARMEKSFGAAGLRRRYQAVFDYLLAHT